MRPGYCHRVVDGLITGLHDPESSHIDMIYLFLEESLLRSACSSAQSLGYMWHEFGDLSLFLRGAACAICINNLPPMNAGNARD